MVFKTPPEEKIDRNPFRFPGDPEAEVHVFRMCYGIWAGFEEGIVGIDYKMGLWA